MLAQYDQIEAKLGEANFRKLVHRAVPALLKEGYAPEGSSVAGRAAKLVGLNPIEGDAELSLKASEQVKGALKFDSSEHNESDQRLLGIAEHMRLTQLAKERNSTIDIPAMYRAGLAGVILGVDNMKDEKGGA
ncbi:MAG: hypothetical protein MZW92_31465 [Comamonadaceae bacterium]|nr:hypothetical protein [Comamonadaceae bacterium]